MGTVTRDEVRARLGGASGHTEEMKTVLRVMGGNALVTFALLGAWPGLVPCPELRRAFRVGDVLLRLELES